MQIKNKKISELEEAQDMNGFFTIGYRIVNGVKTSLKFGLEKVQIAYDGMLAIKDNALDAICDIRALEEVVETSESNRVAAEQDRKTEYGGVIQSLQQAGETSSAQTALAKNATDAANAATTDANDAVTGIDAKMQAAIDALIAGAPGALDTLNELAAALGNDPNFATTVLNELGKKFNRADIINDLVSGGIDKPFSAEMGKSLKSFLDTHNHDGKYQPISNDIAKVYNTTLAIGNIEQRTDKAMTQEEYDEVWNIVNKYKEGYVVTIVDESGAIFRYGTVIVSMRDDHVPTTLIFHDDNGDVLAYTVDDLRVGALWVITNKTSSKVYVSPFKFNEVTSGSFLTEAQKSIITDININYEKGNIVVMSETSITNFKFGVINFAHSATTGTTLSIVNNDGDLIAYDLDGTTIGASRWTVTNKTTGGGGGESNVYVTTLPIRGILNGSVTTIDSSQEEEIYKLTGYAEKNILIKVNGDDLNINDGDTIKNPSVPITFSESSTHGINIVFHISEYSRTYICNLYSESIFEGGKWHVSINEVSVQKNAKIPHTASSSASGGLELKYSSMSIEKWAVLKIDVGWRTMKGDYECCDSIPVKIPTGSDTYTITSCAFNIHDCTMIPVLIIVTNNSIKIDLTSYEGSESMGWGDAKNYITLI